MTLIQSVLLSIVQGVTEFLPISSSGHINLLQHFFGLKPSLTFDIFLNTASLFSVLFFFRSKISYFFTNLKYIFVGTLPAIIVGLLFKDQIESIFSSITTLPYEFIITGLILISTKYLNSPKSTLNYKNALFMGCMQAFAIIPAISRSGSTIFAGLLSGLSPLAAFNFSFALFIPASLGALLLDLRNLSDPSYLSYLNLTAFVTTFIVGVISLSFLQKVMTGRQIWKFGYYAIALGIVLLIIL